MKIPTKILVSRTDRLGDVLLATPVLKKLKESLPQAQITFLVQKSWMEILKLPGIELMEYRSGDATLCQQIKEKQFDIAVVIRDEKEVSRAIKKARVPIRIGPYSTIRSFFLFNNGLLQQRSKCKMHEAEYNLQLLERMPAPIKVTPASDAKHLPRSWIAYDAQAVSEVQVWLSKNQLDPAQTVCVHPGSRGSARYIKIDFLISLVKALLKAGRNVVLTGTESEKSLIDEIAKASGLSTDFLFVGRSLPLLAELYKQTIGVVAHGTGPLHLAAAVDANVYAIFPPIFVLSEKRWGPLTDKGYTWVPTVECPVKYECLGEKCRFYDCMDLFKVEEAVQKILQWKKGS